MPKTKPTTPKKCPTCGRTCYAITRDKFSPPCWPKK